MGLGKKAEREAKAVKGKTNSLGELSSRCAASQEARSYHNQALTIARDVGVPLEEARALEGIGRCYLQDGNDHKGTTRLQQALTIYRRIGTCTARILD